MRYHNLWCGAITHLEQNFFWKCFSQLQLAIYHFLTGEILNIQFVSLILFSSRQFFDITKVSGNEYGWMSVSNQYSSAQSGVLADPVHHNPCLNVRAWCSSEKLYFNQIDGSKILKSWANFKVFVVETTVLQRYFLHRLWLMKLIEKCKFQSTQKKYPQNYAHYENN